MNSTLNHNDENYTCRVEDTTAVFEFKRALFEMATDLEKNRQFFSLLHRIEETKEVQSILISHAPGAVEQSEYEYFLQHIHAGDAKGHVGLGTETDVLISREEHAINQLLRFLSQSVKVTAIGLQGRIVPPFFGIALACDLRFAAEDSTFLFATEEVDIPPSGGLCFFLPLYVGWNKATELVLGNNGLQTDEALAMGLINSVLPVAGFSEQCREELSRMIGLPPSVLAPTKALLHGQRREEFERYMDEEYKVIHSAWCDRLRRVTP